ncbi:MAG TPA: DUF885 domain-containing protein [Verrucomicrobiae bacterium]|nr:DUF885 domain-containing protein [Verrucomicrobiae bacterium]
MPTASPQDERFAALADAYFTQALQLNPVEATAAGLHDYDAQLGDFSPAGFAQRVALDRDTLAKLQSIDPSALSPGVALDATLLSDRINDDLLTNVTLSRWRHDPDGYVREAVDAILGLTGRDYAPLRTRFGYAIARERQIPAMLSDAQSNLVSVDAVTRDIASEDAGGAAELFRTELPQAFAAVKDVALQRQFALANAAAVKAMAGYARWIEARKPGGTFAIGPDAYRKRLIYEDALNLPLDRYLAYGTSALARTRARFVAVAKQIDPKATPLQVYLSITKARPARSASLAQAAGDLAKLRSFVIAKHVVTLPPGATVAVVEAPAFGLASDGVSEDSPGPLESVATQSYLRLTPAYLADFDDAGFSIVAAREVYPGRFTNLAIDRGLDLSLTRKLSASSEFAEGWAQYAVQTILEEGWGKGDPRVRLVQLDAALLRECRYVAGVKLHTAGMTIAQARRLFADECFQAPQVAQQEALRGTQDPMYGSATLGTLMILKLRADYKKKLGAAFTLEKFHDELLSRGDPPIPLLRPFVLGADDDGRPL